MTRIEGISWFRKPWEYGARLGRGSLGALIVGPDLLVVEARDRKQVGGLVDTAVQNTGMAGAMIAEAVAGAKQETPQYRLEIPRSSIKQIIPLPLQLGLAFRVVLEKGEDQLDVSRESRDALEAALRENGYPLVTLSSAQKFVPLAVAAAVILALIFFRC